MTELGSERHREENAGIQIGGKRPFEAKQAREKRQRTLNSPPLSGAIPPADRERLIMASDDLVAHQAGHWAAEAVRRTDQNNTRIESLEADLIRVNSEVNTMVLSEGYSKKKLDDAEANLKSSFERIAALEETIAAKDKEIQSFEKKRQELVNSCVRQLEEAHSIFFLEGWEAAMNRAQVPINFAESLLPRL